MPTVRQKILNYIIERQSTTVDELSKVFRLTPADIRHHLSILVQQGSVESIGQKPSLPKGRPAKIYTTSQQVDRDNLGRLSDALLSTLLFNNAPFKKNLLLDELAERISSKYAVNSSNPTKRLYRTIQALNKMNYQAHWEARFDHPRIMIGRCPYKTILDDHPELCRMDAALLKYLLQAQVLQTDKQVLDAKNLPQCVFLVYPST